MSTAPLSLIERYRASERRVVAGVMSGTSLDGIDVAICEVSGTGAALRQTLVGFACVPFEERMP
jgi:anhydro-N-acetylmuramic acid kinase